MSYSAVNPFDITKATDFTDQQIKDYWVDMLAGRSFRDMAKPTSFMPMIMLGGKGSGKTHLMRYVSYPIQKILHARDVIGGIRDDGFIGIYLRCGGLNAHRFSGKGQDDDTWAVVYSYCMDLWLSQLTLSTILDAFGDSSELVDNDRIICQGVGALLDAADFEPIEHARELLDRLAAWQKDADNQINNCARTHRLDITIRATPGQLFFGIPKVLANCLPSLRQVVFVYLIDEFENLSEGQQRYVNTLVRERQPPVSIKIGARLYGMKTLATYSDNEVNKEGSEFEYLFLDDQLRKNERHYRQFALKLVARRLSESGYLPMDCQDDKAAADFVRGSFDAIESTEFSGQEVGSALKDYSGGERPYFRKLRERLQAGVRARVAAGISSEEDLEQVIRNLSFPEYPLLEKVNILLLYRDWSAGHSLLTSSVSIRDTCRRFIETDRAERSYWTVLGHYGSDLLAQLVRECGDKQHYLGFDTFVNVSDGLPRNLLVILKNIFQWAVFNGEHPFRDQPISWSAQREGLREASEWFFRDARAPGGDGNAIRDSIERLATLFRELRFSDKPSECSLTTFSGDLTRASDRARRIIELARQWSLLIYVGEQSNRNSQRKDPKYQLNRMLAPRYDLPIARRGVIDLSPMEIDAIFAPTGEGQFQEILKKRRDRTTAPFWGKRRKREQASEQDQEALFSPNDHG